MLCRNTYVQVLSSIKFSARFLIGLIKKTYLVTARKPYINVKNMMLRHIFEMNISADFVDSRPFGAFLSSKPEIGKIFIPEKSSNVLFLSTLSSFRASTI